MTKRKTPCSLLLAFAIAACDEPPEPAARPSFPDQDAAGTADDDAGAGERSAPHYAVLSGDWSACSIALLGADGAVLSDNYISSGSVQAGLVTALSGDVDLPTQSGDPGVLVLIDRFRTDVITRIRLSDGEVLGQLKTHTPPTQATNNAFSSNPHDYVRIDEETAWVTRNQPNLDPGVAEIDRGNDLLRINPATLERSDERIDLSSLNTTATRTNIDTGAEELVEVYARPSRMARVGDTLIVGLGLSAFDFSAFGPGTVAVVDLATKRVEGLAFDGLSGCTKAAPIPNESERVMVACAGQFGETRQTAGFAIVHVNGGAARIDHVWRARDHATTPALSGPSVALGGTLIAAAADDDAGLGPSVFGLLDLASGEFTELLSTTAGPGTFGTPLYDADAQLLLVPDASMDADARPTAGVHRFERHGDSFEETALISVAEDTAMPARHVYPL
jgi:hypothetical protein